MFKKILVANRGEIALRIIRACRELGVRTVIVYADVDADSLPVRQADEHICIGPADGSLSYRNIPNVLSAAEVTGVDAIHPGYGFLAENADFAEICTEYGIKFIGPTPAMIRKMGDKVTAKETMIKAGVPVVPGSDGLVKNVKEGLVTAEEVGYPIILKATAGGGGKGMRIARNDKEAMRNFSAAMSEAQSSFGDDKPRMYLSTW